MQITFKPIITINELVNTIIRNSYLLVNLKEKYLLKMYPPRPPTQLRPKEKSYNFDLSNLRLKKN